MIEGFKIKLLPLEEQQSIASILSAIDDKIENNLAIMHSFLRSFKKWFENCPDRSLDGTKKKHPSLSHFYLGLIPRFV